MIFRSLFSSCFFFFNVTATTEIYTLSLHDALPILATFPVIYLIAAVLVASPGVRYQDVIPLIPFFALLAAVFIQFIFQALFKKQWLVTGAVLVLGMILLIPYVRMVIRMDYGYWERSVRYFASRWAARNIPQGSSVIRESKTLSLDNSRYRSAQRSEERRVGKECRSRWSPDH